MKIALIGCGAWGKNYLRILNDLQIHCQVVDPQHTGSVNYEYAAQWCDAAIVATPASTHADITCDLMERGKHVLVEKPMATSLKQAKAMASMSYRRRLVLMVSDPFSYSFRERCPKLPRYARAIWTNMGRARTDVSVFWDMAPHALGVLYRWFGQAISARRTNNEVLSLSYPGHIEVDVVVSWSLIRTRELSVVTTNDLFTWNMDSLSPKEEPLREQVSDFLSSVEREWEHPLDSSIETVRILEMAGC